MVLKAATPTGKPPSNSEMQAAIGVLLNRVNGTGNSGAQVQTQGDDQITVTLPGQVASSLVDLIDTTAYLTFRPVLLIAPYTGVTTTTPAASGTPTPSATPSGTASSTAKATVSPTPSVSSTASAKASTSDVSAQLASPSATPTASATTSATAGATTKALPRPTASATPSPSATASAPASYGDPSAVSAATMKLFDKLVCKPGPNANTVDDSWKKTVPGYTEDLSPWDTPDRPDRLLRRERHQVRARPGRGQGHRRHLGQSPAGQQRPVDHQHRAEQLGRSGVRHADQEPVQQVLRRGADDGQRGAYTDDWALDQIGIALDGDVQSAPLTEGALTSGSFEINGPTGTGFTQAEATQLSNVLKYGALPLTFTLANESVGLSAGRPRLA